MLEFGTTFHDQVKRYLLKFKAKALKIHSSEVLCLLKFPGMRFQLCKTKEANFARAMAFKQDFLVGYGSLPAGKASEIIRIFRNHSRLTRVGKKSVRGSLDEVSNAIFESVWRVYQPYLCELIGVSDVNSNTQLPSRVGLVEPKLCPVEVSKYSIALGIHPIALCAGVSNFLRYQNLVSRLSEVVILGGPNFQRVSKESFDQRKYNISFSPLITGMRQNFTLYPEA